MSTKSAYIFRYIKERILADNVIFSSTVLKKLKLSHQILKFISQHLT